MALPLIAIAQVLLDLLPIIVMIAAVISIAGIVKDFLAENLVEILVDMPVFDHTFGPDGEGGNTLFHVYSHHRDMVLLPLWVIGALAWLVTGRFGHRVSARFQSEAVKEQKKGVPDFMRQQEGGLMSGGSRSRDMAIGFGRDQPREGGVMGTWFGVWLAGLPSRCLLFTVLLFLLPPAWDAAVDASGWTAGVILNPVYSGSEEYPCPADWYVDGRLDMGNPDMLEHHRSVQYLMAQSKTGELEAMCRPELRVRYMLEQWGGETKAIPPPLEGGGSPWEMVTQMWDNAADWMIRGAGEFFVNVILGVVKAQAVLMSGTTMLFSNMVVDVAVATMIVFAPFYFLLMLVPWDNMGGGKVKETLMQFAPAILAAAIIYPIEVSILFAISSQLMVYLLASEQGNNVLMAWLFGTSVMSMAVAMPIVTLGAFAQVIGQVTGQFTSLIQTAQGGLGAMAGGVSGRVGGAIGGAGAGGAAGGAAGKIAGGPSPGGIVGKTSKLFRR